MKKLSILTTVCFATSMMCAFSYQTTQASKKQVHLSVTNKTDQTLVIAARYAVLPPKDPNLMGMPNPFIFVEVPAHETISADFSRIGGGRLGELEEIVVRTQDHYALKTLGKNALDAINAKDSVKVTVDNNMLPKSK